MDRIKIKQLKPYIIVDGNNNSRCSKGCCYLKNLQIHPTLGSLGLCSIYNAYIVNLLRYSGCVEEGIE